MSTGKIISLIKSLGGAGGTGTSDLPFGTEVTYTEILPQETVTVAATEGSSALSANLTGLVPIEVGKKYRVTFDGVAYACVAFNHASWGAICLGNGRLNGGSTEKTDEPFCINVWASTAASISLATEGTHTVSVDEIVETHTPIQPEYLTGEKPQPYMHLVTDGEGQAGWEQRLAWDEGDTNKVIADNVAMTFDGSQPIPFTFDFASLTVGTQCKLTINDEVYDCTVSVASMQGISVFYIGNLSFMNPSAVNTGESYMFVAAGVSGEIQQLAFFSNAGEYTVSLVVPVENVHHIDSKLIPTYRDVVSFPMQQIYLQSDNYGHYTYQLDFALEIGRPYKVSWDGVVYDGVVFDYDGEGTVMLGGLTWPFSIVSTGKAFYINTTDGTVREHMVEIIECAPLITPEMLPTTMQPIVFTKLDESTVECAKTPAEILAMTKKELFATDFEFELTGNAENGAAVSARFSTNSKSYLNRDETGYKGVFFSFLTGSAMYEVYVESLTPDTFTLRETTIVQS